MKGHVPAEHVKLNTPANPLLTTVGAISPAGCAEPLLSVHEIEVKSTSSGRTRIFIALNLSSDTTSRSRFVPPNPELPYDPLVWFNLNNKR